MKRSTFLVMMCLLPLLVVGCSSDDVLSLIDLQEDAAAVVAGTSTEVLAPVIERLNLLEVFEGVPTKAGLGLACSAVTDCTSGTWEHCESPQGFDYTFDACVLDGQMVTGTLSATGSDVAGTVNFAVTVDALSYAGFVTFAQSGDCIVETLSQFSVRDSFQVSILGGELTYCPGSVYPNGSLNVSISGSSTFSLDATFDGTQTAGIVFAAAGTTYDCTAGLATGAATCQ